MGVTFKNQRLHPRKKIGVTCKKQQKVTSYTYPVTVTSNQLVKSYGYTCNCNTHHPKGWCIPTPVTGVGVGYTHSFGLVVARAEYGQSKTTSRHKNQAIKQQPTPELLKGEI